MVSPLFIDGDAEDNRPNPAEEERKQVELDHSVGESAATAAFLHFTVHLNRSVDAREG